MSAFFVDWPIGRVNRIIIEFASDEGLHSMEESCRRIGLNTIDAVECRHIP